MTGDKMLIPTNIQQGITARNADLVSSLLGFSNCLQRQVPFGHLSLGTGETRHNSTPGTGNWLRVRILLVQCQNQNKIIRGQRSRCWILMPHLLEDLLGRRLPDFPNHPDREVSARFFLIH